MPSIVDASIPLQAVNPSPVDPLKQQSELITLKEMGLKLRADQQAYQSKNALRQIFSNPQSFDAAGNPTPQASQAIMAVDPEMGLKLREDQLTTQFKKAQVTHENTETGKLQWKSYQSAASAGIDAYDAKKAAGGSEADARSAGAAARNEVAKTSGGMLGDDKVAQIIGSPFDPMAAKALAGTDPDRQKAAAKKIELERMDRAQVETVRHDNAMEDAAFGRLNKPPASESKWEVLQDKDGTSYRYNAHEAKATTLTGQPYTPQGASKTGVAKPGGGKLSDDELKMMGEQYLAGDKSVFQNIGRGAQGGENITALRGEIAKQAAAQNMSGSDIAAKLAEFDGIKAGERTLGTRTANVGLAVDEAKKLAPLAVDASRAVSRSSFVPFAKAEQMVQKGTNDENLRRFVAANNSLINVYARGISPTGVPTVSDKDHGREMLDTAFDQKSYEAVVDQMMKEMTAAQTAPGDVRKELREAVTGKPDKADDKAVKIAKPTTKAEYEALPKGATFIDPDDGKTYKKP